MDDEPLRSKSGSAVSAAASSARDCGGLSLSASSSTTLSVSVIVCVHLIVIVFVLLIYYKSFQERYDILIQEEREQKSDE